MIVLPFSAPRALTRAFQVVEQQTCGRRATAATAHSAAVSKQISVADQVEPPTAFADLTSIQPPFESATQPRIDGPSVPCSVPLALVLLVLFRPRARVAHVGSGRPSSATTEPASVTQ